MSGSTAAAGAPLPRWIDFGVLPLLNVLLALAVAGVSAWALRPVRRLAEAVRARSDDDLRPLSPQGLPADLRPLVDAINRQLERSAGLLAQRRQFVDDASHQLRTPLTTLRAQLDYLRREADPARRDEALQALSLELDHATRATGQLLALARADAGARADEPLDLGELVREVALALLPLARERGIDLGVDGPEPAPVARGDRLLLREALQNLAHNALVHGRAGGRVTLVAGADPDPDREAGGQVWIGASDDGPGLEPAVAARLGQRFVRGRGSRGSGLGLSIAAAVAVRHGGSLQTGAGEGGAGLAVRLCWPGGGE